MQELKICLATCSETLLIDMILDKKIVDWPPFTSKYLPLDSTDVCPHLIK